MLKAMYTEGRKTMRLRRFPLLAGVYLTVPEKVGVRLADDTSETAKKLRKRWFEIGLTTLLKA